MRFRPAGLWGHREFVKLWLGTAVSVFGAEVTGLAIPLLAVLTLHATPTQMGLLRASGSAAALLLGPVAGAWLDRVPRRPVLIGADVGRAVLLGVIPGAALAGALCMELLYAVALLVGALSVCFDVAYMAYLPSLVPRHQLAEGNSKLSATYAAAQTVGQGAGGALVQALTAPVAVAVDALSYLVSAAALWRIRAPEPPAPPAAARRPLAAEIREGGRFVWTHPLLRAVAAYLVVHFFFVSVFLTVAVLYWARERHVTPLVLGGVSAALGAGSFAGALLARPAAARLGVGRAMVAGAVLDGVALLAVPAAGGGPGAAAGVAAAAYFALGVGILLMSVNQLSLRQAITPDRLQGRMNATFRTANLGAALGGALLGGALGEAVGLRATLAVGALGVLAAAVPLLRSPLPTLREPPRAVE
jgi:MFS family permease